MAIFLLAGVWQGAEIERFVQAYTTKAYSELSYSQWTEALVLDRQGRVIATVALLRSDAQTIVFAVPQNVYARLEAHLQIYLKMMRIGMHLLPIAPDYTPRPFYPWITNPNHSGVFTAHDLSADVLGLINFTKGCYLGQEIVARVQSKIQEHKKRLSICCLKLDNKDYAILYSHCQFTIGVLPRSVWNKEGVLYVWDQASTKNNDLLSFGNT